MSFNILYVEDNPKDWKRLNNVIDKHNKMPPPEKITLIWAKSIDELEDKLNHTIDIVLADMYLTPSPYDKGDRLRDVVNIVSRWCEKNEAGRPIPIIAYTVGGEDAFKNKNDLYDIWDKNTASVEYVTWRLSNLSKELTRLRPDALIQTLIRTEIDKSCAVSWHGDVLDMIKRYDKSLTEADQINKAGHAIENIAHNLTVRDNILPLWKVIKNWEFLGRAVSPNARGHARHSINVFWLGYYLLHKEPLRDFFIGKWEYLKNERPKMSAVKKVHPIEAIHNIWFYTSLFHDMALCLESFPAIQKFQKDLYSSFDDLKLLSIKNIPDKFSTKGISEDISSILNEFEEPLSTQLKDAWDKKLKDDKADHGMLSALKLISVIPDEKQERFAREAARAIATHSLTPNFLSNKVSNLTWNKEPFACLLLLCDQLQTWHRERGDQTQSDNDGPERAELSELEISKKDGYPFVKITIDYIARQHLKHAPEIYDREKQKLSGILMDNPERALKKIDGDWPFSLRVEFSLSKDPLSAFIDIPGKCDLTCS